MLGTVARAVVGNEVPLQVAEALTGAVLYLHTNCNSTVVPRT
jgi:hypothetical protein